MNEYDFEGDLQSVLQGDDFDGLFVEAKGVENVATFEQAGVLTRNKGLVVRMNDGSEFQITIVQSK
jgi:hypothetical protein